MANYQRRRNQNHLRYYLIPIISTISTVLLLLLALLSFLAPPPPDNDQFPHHHQRSSSFDNSDGVVLTENQTTSSSNQIKTESTVFRVPIHGGSSSGNDLWTSRISKFFYGCSNSSHKFAKAEVNTVPNRYLMIATSGGLNQQRTGMTGITSEPSIGNDYADDVIWQLRNLLQITDAVVAARILNTTLIVPKLDQKSFWKDSSNFTEIFDVDWFISFLSKDVKILKQLPKKGGKIMGSYNMRVPRKCNAACYQKRVLPVLLKKRAVQLTKFDYRLANRLDTDLQKLRCRVNYHALRFTTPILTMGQKLVQRMRMRSRHFIALHLRFEPDMLAFSGCDYGGGEKEMRELGAIRKRWKTLHGRNPEKERRHGKCPLTPEEVGLMLRALGFGSDIHLYVASGEVYGGEETLAPLKALFPHFHTKETITRNEELSPFSSFSSRMAALDFIVCDESDVFVTNNNGNMARMLAGRRRYFGHKRTIRPNAKKLYSLFLNRSNMTWEAFASRVRTHQRGFMGEPNEVRPGRGEFHENPSTCICEYPEAKESGLIKVSSKSEKGNDTSKAGDEPVEDDEPDWIDMDYGENQNGIQDYGLMLKADEPPELEDMLSD